MTDIVNRYSLVSFNSDKRKKCNINDYKLIILILIWYSGNGRRNFGCREKSFFKSSFSLMAGPLPPPPPLMARK